MGQGCGGGGIDQPRGERNPESLANGRLLCERNREEQNNKFDDHGSSGMFSGASGGFDPKNTVSFVGREVRVPIRPEVSFVGGTFRDFGGNASAVGEQKSMIVNTHHLPGRGVLTGF